MKYIGQRVDWRFWRVVVVVAVVEVDEEGEGVASSSSESPKGFVDCAGG